MKITKKRVRMAEGLELDLFSISHLAAALGRTTQTIVLWEKSGFPPPIIDTGDGLRWYTRNEIDAYREISETLKLSTHLRSYEKAGFFASCQRKAIELKMKLYKEISEAKKGNYATKQENSSQ